MIGFGILDLTGLTLIQPGTKKKKKGLVLASKVLWPIDQQLSVPFIKNILFQK